MENKKKIIITSGYFNPLHIGHLEYIKKSKMLGDYLIVIVNNDTQALLKKEFTFQLENHRIDIIKALKYPDEVVLSIDNDRSVCKTIKMIYDIYKEKGYEFIFAKGGDQTKEIIPEKEICDQLGIKIVDKVVGQLNSSTNILENYRKYLESK